MLEGKKAAIFDLDGTLVDSMWMWKDIDIEFLARYGYECPEDLQKAIEGMSFSETEMCIRDSTSATTDTERSAGTCTQIHRRFFLSMPSA